MVVELPGPRPSLARLCAVLRRRTPVRDELDSGNEGPHVDSSAEVDEYNAAAGPATGAVGAPLRREALTLGRGCGPAWVAGGSEKRIQTQQAIVCLDVAVQDLFGMERLDGAEKLDGEEHGELLVHNLRRFDGAEVVDDVEKCAIWVVG